MKDLAESIREMARAERRPNAVDAEWERRPSESAWIAEAPKAELAHALGEALPNASAIDARYALWLCLDAMPDADLPALAKSLGQMSDPDARVVATFMLLGRARSAPSWLQAAIRETLAATENAAARNMGPSIEILRKVLLDPARFELQNGLLAGARLFDAGKYFEAHEAWEDVWRPQRGSERDFFRGLINLAVAMNKAKESNPNGVLRLLERADLLLAPYEPAHRGLDVRGLRQTMARLSTQAVAWRDGRKPGLDETPTLPITS